MNTSPPSDPTLAYYEAHAEEFVRDTLHAPVEPLYEDFLALVPAGGHILDAGCGSGRDSLAFLRRGYKVTAIDASPTLARLASATIGRPVAVLPFQAAAWENSFAGIWACASLLHVPRREMDDVITRFTRALRPGGAWYMSFKHGEAEEERGGRLFNDYTEAGLRHLLSGHPRLGVVRIWQTEDVRAGPQRRLWINGLVQRRGG